MDYTIENGIYYKVENENGELITFGELKEGEVLSTIETVIFLSKEEFEDLNKKL